MIFPFAIPAFRDNYIWLIDIGQARPQNQGAEPREVIIVDPGDASPVIACLEANHLKPQAIFVTHHHYDHVDGIANLVQRYQLPVFGPGNSTIPGLTDPVSDLDVITIAPDISFQVFATPGHTLDHISYYTPGMLFCGDTLFAAGCGRLFEGTPEQMFRSLSRINLLPGDTKIYCTHEYTIANLEFAQHVETDNKAISVRLQHCNHLRSKGQITLPSTLAEERQTNPFMRCTEATVMTAASQFANRPIKDPADTFKVIRFWKDTW